MAFCKIPGLLFFFLLIVITADAQPLPFNQPVADSIVQRLSTAKDDTSKVKSLILLAQMYISKTDSGMIMKFLQEANTISKKINYTSGRIESLSQMAFFHSITGDWPLSIMEIDEAIPLCEAENSKWIIFLGNLMFMNSASKNDLKEARSWVLKAVHHPLFQSLEEMNKWPTYMQLGLVYEWADQLDSAQYYGDILKKYLVKYRHQDLENNTYFLIGNIARKRKRYDEALHYFSLGERPNYMGLAWVYEELNKFDSAIYFAKLALKSGQDRKDYRTILESTKLLARRYSVLDPKLGYQYLLLYIDTKDELFNSSKLKELEEIRLTEQKRQFEKENQQASYRSKIIQLSLIGLATLFFVSALLFWRNNRIKRTANKKLEKAYLDLKATQAQLIQSEKMASLGELTAGIAHEIQNPLNFVNNFSDVNKELLEEMKEQINKGNLDNAKEIATDVITNEEKINHHGKRADAIVKGMLQHSRNSSATKEPTDINILADEYLRLAYHGLRAKDKSFNATLKTDYDEHIGKVNIIPQDIGRVILNLINNAFYTLSEKKKQHSEGFEPTVSVGTKKIGDKVMISVKDNGSGIPQKIVDKIFQPFFTTKPTGQGTGLGLSLSYDIIKAHGGEIKVETQQGEGTVFIIELSTI